MATISRQQYNDLYGPTVGDKIRLGDTELYAEITEDLCVYGDEVVYGGEKLCATVWDSPIQQQQKEAHSTW